MSLLDHAMNILGVGGGLSLGDIRWGYTVTKVEWDGCMANVRNEVDVGTVVRHFKKGGYDWVMVDYDKRGMVHEPAAHFRRVCGELEVWS